MSAHAPPTPTDIENTEIVENRAHSGCIPPRYRVERVYNRLMDALLLFGSLLIGLLAIPISIDVFARMFLGWTIDGIMEIEVMTLVVIAFSCMGYTIYTRQPIKIDLFYLKTTPKTQARLDFFVYALCACISAVLAYETWVETLDWPIVTVVLQLPEQYFFMWTSIGFSSILIGSIFQLIHSGAKLLERKDYAGIVLSVFFACCILLLPFAYRFSGLQLSGLATGSIGFLLLIVLLFLRMPIGLAMALVGLLGLIAILRQVPYAFSSIGVIPFRQTADFIFVALPMFMLMGELSYFSGLSRDLFNCANKWLGRLPGGLAIASVGGCAGFGAICGDSFACVVTMSSVALPAMQENHYDDSLACGALAAGGTLGILIPPSMGFIFYSIMTEESVGTLFIAGIIPGLLLTLIFMGIIYVQVKLNPSLAPSTHAYSYKEKLLSTVYLIPVIAFFGLVVGGIVLGWFTPGEGGAVGAMAAFFYAIARRRLSLAQLMQSLRSTAIMSGKIFLIFAGVYILGAFLAQSRLPNLLSDAIFNLQLNRYIILFIVCALYLVLGCVMNILPMMMLTLPSLYPTIMALGFDGIWFGVITVILMEMGMITPPVGMNVFTLSSLAPDIPMSTIFRGVLPFFLGMILCVIILTIFPELVHLLL